MPPYCDSIDCPGRFTPIDNANEVQCEDDPCEVSQCCDVFCLYPPCPDEPCEPEETAYCNSIGCPDGYTPIDNAKEVECEDDPCRVAQCCEAFCRSHACPNGCTPVADAAAILCDDFECTTEQCCDCGELIRTSHLLGF